MKSGNLYLELGLLVRKNRRKMELTQDTLGERVGLSRTSITNIESGRQKILIHQLFLLAEALDVTPQALLPKLQPTNRIEQIEQTLPKDLSRKDKELILRMIQSKSSVR